MEDITKKNITSGVTNWYALEKKVIKTAIEILEGKIKPEAAKKLFNEAELSKLKAYGNKPIVDKKEVDKKNLAKAKAKVAELEKKK